MSGIRQDHDRIIPTARMVAYFRSFSDIPYAAEISKVLGGEEAAKAIHQRDLDMATTLCGPFLEARYKCFNRFTAAYSNVLELAVGTSVERGISISHDPARIYIGTDLPEMIEESKALLEKMNVKKRRNLYFEAANVLSFEELSAAVRHLGARRDVAIISEGLFTYLTTDEQAVFAENVRRILECYGGIWVTPDITDLESQEQLISCLGREMSLAMPRMMRAFSNSTGRDLEKNSFSSRREAVEFFQRFGFEVVQHPLVNDLRCLTSIAKLWGEREKIHCEPALRQRLVWVMSLRHPRL